MKKTAQKSDLVIKQFEDQIEDYTKDSLVHYSHVVPFLEKWFQKHTMSAKSSICEFGGGGGNLLDLIQKKTGTKAACVNVELVGKYKKYQANPSIHFVCGSVLDSGFDDASQDVVIVRNVLHHLVTDTLQGTRDNQMDAIRELLRVTKKGGVVIIEEQTNNNLFACLAFFYLSTFASKIGIRIDRLQITPNTIVGYMTRKTLLWMCERHCARKDWEISSYERWNLPWYWKITGLMNDTGESFVVMQKR